MSPLLITSFVAGPETLSNVDRLAHNSLLSQHHIQNEVLPRISGDLALNLWDTLSPLLSDNDGDVPQSRAANEEEDEFSLTQDKSVVEVFPEIFSEALKLKGKLMVSGKQFQWRFFRPGMTFDDRTMEKSSRDYDSYPARGKKPTTHSRQVKLCLFPALFSHSKTATDDGGLGGLELEQCMVNHQNFRDAADESQQSDVMVSKAIVYV